jgi:hypothetical protein
MRRPYAAAVLVFAAACAAHNPPQQVGDGPRDVGIVTPRSADDIPLLTTHGIKGCHYRVAGELAAASPAGLRDQAVQKLANAVIDVRQQTQVNQQRGPVLRPAATVYYTGTAVRFDDPSCVPAAEH